MSQPARPAWANDIWLVELSRWLLGGRPPAVISSTSKRDRDLWGVGSDRLYEASHFLRKLEETGAVRVSKDWPYQIEEGMKVELLDAATMRRVFLWPEPRPTPKEALRKSLLDLGVPPEASESAASSFYQCKLPHGELAAALARLALDPSMAAGLTPRQLSSLAFMGHSKILDDKERFLDQIGALARMLPAPLLFNVSLPPPSIPLDGLLFVENQDTFLMLAKNHAIAHGLAILYAQGFKAGTARLRSASARSISYLQGAERAFELEAALSDRGTPCYFFGDLDFSGMGILGSIRVNYPNAMAWRPGYDAMLAVLEAGGGHLPAEADKEGQRDPGSTGCDYADSILLPALRARGRMVDQEGALKGVSLCSLEVLA